MASKALVIKEIKQSLIKCDTGYTSLSHAVYLGYSLDYVMTGKKNDTEDPLLLSKITGKVIYTYDSVVAETLRYGGNKGVGCVFCYLDENNKWWTIGTYNDSFEIVTAYSMYSELTGMFDNILTDSFD